MRYVIVFLLIGVCSGQNIAACDSQIYCDGPLLDAIQMARLFPDGKTFVDMSLKQSPDTVLGAFNNLTNHSKATLEYFVSQYFSGPGEELEIWEPTDFVKLPSFLNNIKDPVYKDFGWDLCRIWKDLGRKVKDDVKLHADMHSMVYLPKPFIVPGGRFRETFYWDSYWVIKGLLVCEMNSTVKGMLENFLYYVQKFGFIPNGGRVYFTRRSQPPFLIQMMYDYYEATNDFDFIKQHIATMESEYEFWQSNRSVSIEKSGKVYHLNQYSSNVVKPRPESYYEDVVTTQNRTSADRKTMYSNLASACESGWDFSSRWFSREEGATLTLNTISTMSIIPVDLNSILCQNERILIQFYQRIGNLTKVSYYKQRLANRLEAIDSILYNEKVGIWLDYSLKTNTSRDFFYMSNIFPVFMNCANLTGERSEKLLAYIQKHKLDSYKGGIPTTLDNTGQQWDFPNGWSPLEHVMIWALDSIPQTQHVARALVTAWLESNYLGWQRTRSMFEKYNVSAPGTRGGGGEYGIQEGFGWTNGVVLDILKKYGRKITSSSYVPKTNCVNGSFTPKAKYLFLFICVVYLYILN